MMKRIVAKILVGLCMVTGVAHADVNACYSQIEKAIKNKLNTTKIDYAKESLAGDMGVLLQPVLDKVIADDAACKSVRDDLLLNSSVTLSVDMGNNYIFDIDMAFVDSVANSDKVAAVPKPAELDVLLPWYGILVVKKGSLDKYANADVPIISSEYMKSHRDTFFPANSDHALGMAHGCTHSNHMAHDDDVVNRATHIVMGEEDSFFKGNDYYVYDGEDVYWGTAMLIGEVALALITFGGSSYATAGKAAANAAKVSSTLKSTSAAVKTVDITTDAAKVTKAVEAAKAAKAGASGAASRTAAKLALQEAGVTVKNTATASQLMQIGTALETTYKATNAIKWTSALWKPWRLVKPGIQGLSPSNLGAIFGEGIKWTQKIKRAAVPVAAGGIGIALAKAYGYSSASAELDAGYADNVKFNSFGLLSADDIEGRENEVSHGAWLMFEEAGAVNEDDPLKEAAAFAEDLTKQMSTINAQDPQCDVDIYVVQPGISNPAALGKREVYYVIQTKPGAFRVSK